MRLNPLSRAVAALLPMLLCVAPVVHAQEPTDEEAMLDRVEVTGSRIKRADAAQSAPVLTISSEDIERTGLKSIGDIVQQLTSSGSSLNTKFNSSGNFGFPPDGGGVGAGATTVDLRNLSAKRVLVLVDGIRWVNESSASGVGAATDLNTIPVAIIDRIEVLEDGASSIYGSDAIGGVVNVITKRSMEGAQADLYYGEYDEGDGQTKTADLALGGESENASFFLAASFFDQDDILSADREQSRFPIPGTGVTRGSSATPAGRLIFTDPNTGTEVDLTLPQSFSGRPVYNPANPTGAGSSYIPFSSAQRFNFSPFNYILTPSERKSIFGQVRYEVNDHTRLYVRTLFNQRQSVNQAAPEPIFLGPGAGNGNLADFISIDRTNPFNPFGFTLDANTNLVLATRRPVEGGPRIFSQDVDTYYIAGGLEGDFALGDRQFFWDFNAVRSENDATQSVRGSYNLVRLQRALGPVANCTAPCVPLNLFGGPGTITPAMLNYIGYTGTDRSGQDLTIVSANLSGDIADLPAGPLGFAFGVEYREQEGFYQPDAVTVAGESNGVPSQPTAGEFDVTEAFAEFNVPIIERVELQLAARYSDYSTFGSETTGKAGLRWQPSDELTVRGTYSQGFRAPSIGELFGSVSRFDAQLTDPCSVTPARCAALGVPANYQQINSQISIQTGGNINLQPESSDSFTFGLVYSPGWAESLPVTERLDFEITYYDHEIEDIVQAIDAQTFLNDCVAASIAANANRCTPVVQRNQTGAITALAATLQNLGTLETSGLDVKLFWTSAESDWGRFSATWLNSYVDDFNDGGPRGVGVEVNDSGIPEWNSNFTLDWTQGAWAAGWTLRHTSDLTEVCSDASDGTPNSLTALGLCSNPNTTNNALSTNKLGSTTYHDFRVNWTAPTELDLSVTLGLNNAFDKDPPICLSCSLNGYDASLYDVPGRFYYLQTRVKF